MKIWKIVFVLLTAFSLASCSSDDDTDTYEAIELSGTWQKVYDEGIADAGIVQYTFHPQSANNGTVDIFTSDWEVLVHHLLTVDGLTPSCSESHLLVRFFSKRTIFILFTSSIFIAVLCYKDSDFFSRYAIAAL